MISDEPLPRSTQTAAAPSPYSPVRLLDPTPKKPSRAWLWLLLLSAAALFSQRARLTPPTPAAPPVRTYTVQPGRIERTLRLSGMTTAGNTALMIAPKLPGRRSRGSSSSDFKLTLLRMASPGGYVEKGGLVAEFDRQFLKVRFDDLHADVRGRALSLRNLYTALDVRRKAYEQRIRAAEGAVERARLDLRTAPVRSAIQSERFRLNFEEAQAHLAELRHEAHYVHLSEAAAIRRYELLLEDARLDLDRAERNAERLLVTAPIAGVFIPQRIRRGGEYFEVEAGDDLTPGFNFGQLFDLNTLNIEASANQADLQLLREGQKVRLTAEAFGDLVLPGRITRIASAARGGGARAEHVRHLPIRIALGASDKRLVPNYSVAADVILESADASAVLPLEAIHSEPGQTSPYVWRRQAEVWIRQPVTLGLRNHTHAAVHSGVVAGDIVSLDPIRKENHETPRA
jgi:multidrug efflux pump subunit AcrA (membrane-fusion protein)